MFGCVLYRSVYKKGGVCGELLKNTFDPVRKKNDGPLVAYLQ